MRNSALSQVLFTDHRVIPGLQSQGDFGLESTTERSREQPTTSIAVRERNTPAGALPLRTVL